MHLMQTLLTFHWRPRLVHPLPFPPPLPCDTPPTTRKTAAQPGTLLRCQGTNKKKRGVKKKDKTSLPKISINTSQKSKVVKQKVVKGALKRSNKKADGPSQKIDVSPG
jgi:hypothetical protein